MINILTINTSSHDCLELVHLLKKLSANMWHAKKNIEATRITENNPISTIIFLAENQALEKELTHFIFPSHIPILIIHPELKPLEFTSPVTIAQFVDVYQPPLTHCLLQQKLELLDRINKQYLELQETRYEKSTLKNKIADLHQSVEGHNIFIDLMSRRDGLTGLFNRRHFSTIIQQEFKRAKKDRNDLSLLILNIDYFNEINKSCGQDYGDFVLNEFSARITGNTRTEDFCFRYSGENFAILMPSVSTETAYNKAEELRKICETKVFNNGHIVRKVTISIGLAAIIANVPTTHEELINMADEALFLAKSEGRNRCNAYAPIDRSQSGTPDQNFKHLKETISRILEKTKSSSIRSLQLLANGIMEEKDSRHIQQAREFVQLLSKQLFLPPPIIDTVKNTITLHSSIRHLLHTEIINKKGELSTSERETISDLPYKLVEITQLFNYFTNEQSILLHHGERYDGTGYPEGLQGNEIPLGARIFNLANAMAAMNSDRHHRPRLQEEQILFELSANAGKQFDPALVLKLIDVIEENDIFNLDKTTLDNTRKTILLNNPAITSHAKL